MCHFHTPDLQQHLIGDKHIGKFDQKKLRELYKELNSLAAEIKTKAIDKGHKRVIFMSDHGLPSEESQNKNALYSCNKSLFGEATPHISDFHDMIARSD